MSSTKFDKDAAAKRLLSGVSPSPEDKTKPSPNVPNLSTEQGRTAPAASEETPELPQISDVELEQKSKAGRKPKEKRIQASIYFSERQLVTLNEQSGYGKKERDKSALVRFGVDLVLAMSDEEYSELKAKAALQNCEPSEIIRKALSNYDIEEKRGER